MTTAELQLRLQALVRTCADRDVLERAIRMFESSAPTAEQGKANSVNLDALAKAREEFFKRLRSA